ncbi:hypothetical protein PHISP_02381 [Aspergillus sp. HF37]|nr:hypothetical protein PHISP_02381 [Aspergillus sp. HF37]
MTPEEMVDAMTEHIYHGRIMEMVRLFHQTCPGDWEPAPNVSFSGTLRGYYDFDQFEDEDPELAATIRFRWETALLADYIVSLFGLPVPNDEMCILWNRYTWQQRIEATIPDWRDRQYKYFSVSRFVRPIGYLSASLSELEATEETKMAKISEILAFLEQIEQSNAQKVCQNAGVSSCGRLAPILREICSKVGVASQGSCTVFMMSGENTWGVPAFCYLFLCINILF